MNEDIFDILIYLFENYMGLEYEETPDTDILKNELKQAGFQSNAIHKAFGWLESLAIDEQSFSINGDLLFKNQNSVRIFSIIEQDKLAIDCRNFIIFLTNLNIINAAQRELIINRAMEIDHKTILLEELQWIALIILLSQPEDELAIAHLEHLIYQDNEIVLH